MRKLGLKKEEYYKQYYDKKDLLTGEDIEFKNEEQYLNTDFNNKNNLKKWLKENPKKGREWAINWLKKRKEAKALVVAPCEVELRSLSCPSMEFFEKTGGYENAYEAAGLEPRFEGELKFEKLGDVTIIQDSREQKPLDLPYKTIVQKLDVGDYGLEPKYDKKIYVERKGIGDMVGTLSQGFDRFRRELIRAKESDSYLIMLVEKNINKALSFNFLYELKYAKVQPAHVFKNLRDLMKEFLNFQVLFVGSREEAAKAIEIIFSAGESVKNVDLQYWYEQGGLDVGTGL